MASYAAHLIFYAVLALSAYALVTLAYGAGHPGPMGLAAFCAGALYALLPDIDSSTAKIRRALNKFVLASVLALLTAYMTTGVRTLLYAAFASAALLMAVWMSRHRGFLHTPAAGALLSCPLALIDFGVAAAALVGYLSHLALDGRLLPRWMLKAN